MNRILTISWDDGLRTSTEKVARIYERFGLRADFNIVATAHLSQKGVGEFGWWNELAARGHFIHPHGLDHTDKTTLPLAEAKAKIQRCLNIFQNNLRDFDPREAVFAFPYNSSTPEIEDWLGRQVRAFRTNGPPVQNLPGPTTRRLTTVGREDAEACLDECMEQLGAVEDSWLIYTAHGLDGEGWGPIHSIYLERLLGKLVEKGEVRILPAYEVLEHFSAYEAES
jgi:peptidoglycan/xylan/chitin deacetylase (PgdA/CDA1 family)